MARQSGSLALSSNIEPRMDAPLDARTVVNTLADLTTAASFPYFYVGLTVYCKENSKSYTLTGNDPTVSANWVEVGSGAITVDSTLSDASTNPVQNKVVKGAIDKKQNIVQIETFPEAGLDYLGKIYQFIGTTDLNYTNGFYYQCTEDSGVYSWTNIDVQPPTVITVDAALDNSSTNPIQNQAVKNALDLKQDIVQYSTMPIAASTLVNKIVQFVGTTSSPYTNGYYYKCIEDPESAGTYIWQNIKVQDSDVNVIEGIQLNGTTVSPDANKIVNILAIPMAQKGANSGVAELDATGKVPASQLPSYVDDVVEGYYNTTDGKFYEEDTYTTEIPGETGKIYVDLSTEKTYRWSGSAFVEISESLALGETSSTAYAGNKGKQNADNITALQTSKQDVLQYSTMPTPTSTDVGKIVQYTGTTGTYTSGYFYECVEDSENTGSYIWVEKTVQDSSSSSGSLATAITTNTTVGGISSGTTYNVGTSYDTLWKNLLCPTLYPSFTAPSATISATGSKLLEVGATLSSTITTTFSRGTISPSYGTNGYRSGAATSYALNGGTSQASNEFTETVSGSNKSFQVTVEYAVGEQPKDSNGDNYDSPLAAGSVTSNTINFEFVNALWSNTADITSIAKNSLVSKGTKQNTFNFPAATVANPETFDVPASWTITAVEVLNTLSNQWENCASEFTITDTTHDDAGGDSTSYKRYTNNLGYAMDSRKIRIKWS